MDDPVAVANYRTKLEAEIAGGVLREAEIPFIIQSTEGMLHGPIVPGATILVPATAVEAARDALGQVPPPPPDPGA